MQYLNSYFTALFHLTNEMSPYLLLGFIFAGILHVFIKAESISKYLGSKSKFKSSLYAAILGIPLPLCSCGVIPTGISFQRSGASKAATVSFLISTPQTGVDSILVTYSMLGLPFAIIRPLAALFTGIAGGIFSGSIEKEVEIKESATKKADIVDGDSKIKRFFKYAFIEFMQDIADWLLLGLLLAALVAVLIPDDFFSMYIGNPYMEMLLVLVASVPLYLCATGSVPLAAVLLMKGLSPGAVLVFLMAGPATNIATMTVIGKSLGLRSLLSYMLSIIVGAVFFGFIINNFIPESLIFPQSMDLHHHHHQGSFLQYLSYLSTAILLLLLVNIYIRRFILKRKVSAKHSETAGYRIGIKGMSCMQCAKSIEKNLSEVKGVRYVSVSLSENSCFIEGDTVDIEKIKTVIRELGYDTEDEKA